MSRYTPTSVRETGLQNHLGEVRYDTLVKGIRFDTPKTKLAAKLGVSRTQLYYYIDIYHEELTKQT